MNKKLTKSDWEEPVLTQGATRALAYSIEQARDRATATAEEIRDTPSRKQFAEAFCTLVLELVWKTKVRTRKPSWKLAPSGADAGVLDSATRELAVETARLIGQSETELSGYFLGTFYTTLLPKSIRSDWGVFYTPPPLVARLLSSVSSSGLDWTTVDVVDPACGGAAFLAPTAVRMYRALDRKALSPTRILDHICTRLSGVEIDPFAAWMSQALTELRLLDLMIASAKRLRTIVRQGNSLFNFFDQGPAYDLVVGNPPYGKTSLPPQAKTQYARSLFGHPNLYGLFTDLALRITRPEGFVAFVTPASFLAGQYFKALRNILSREAPPVALDFVRQRDVVFQEVLQETVLVVFRKRSREKMLTRITTIDAEKTNGGIKITSATRFALSQLGEKPWLLPRNEKQRDLLQRATQLKFRLAHYGLTVTTGQLVWNRNKDQLRGANSERSLPLIWAESVLPDGTFRFRALRSNHKPYFELRPGQDHLITRQECILVQRTTAKEQRRRLICALLPRSFIEANGGGVVVENHLNIVRNGNDLLSGISLRTVCALLNSQIVDEIFRCISGSVAVSAYELNSIPLPDPEGLAKLDRMIERHEENGNQAESLIARLYGVA